MGRSREDLERLVYDCEEVLQALQEAISTAKTDGRVFIISVSQTMYSLGLRSDRAREIKNCLKELGLIRPVRRGWWYISPTQEIKTITVRRLLNGTLHRQGPQRSRAIAQRVSANS
jgi:hypothetical protein